MISCRDFGGRHVKKALMLSAAAVFGLATAGHAEEMAYAKKPGGPLDAMAADMPYKAEYKKAPAVVDDSLTWHGITLYGQIDFGLTYQSHGAALNGLAGNPVPYLIVKQAQGSHFGVGANQLSASFVGLRGKQEIADGLFAIFNLQTQFNPESGLLSNGIGSIAQNNGVPAAQQNAFADSSKNGQAFNAAAYAGLSSPIWGTVTYGRQNALTSDGVINYDPLASSGAFSVIGFQGLTGGGGDTEERIYDNSIKYAVGVGPFRFAVEAALSAGQFSGGQGNAFEGEVGFDYAGFTFDVIGAKIDDAVAAAPLTSAQLTAATSGASAIGQGLGLVAGTVSDNTAVMALAKYTIGPVKLFAGYEHIDFNNPNNPLPIGSFLPGGYVLGATTNNAFNTTRHFQTVWVGGKYAVRSDFDLTLAYYHEQQGSFQAGPPTARVNVAGCSNSSLTQCSGQLDAVSFVADWRFAKRFDVYAGMMWSQVQNGLASGFLSKKPGSDGTSNFSPSAGLKYSF
jgi:predicted porin